MAVDDLIYEHKYPISKRSHVGIELEFLVTHDNFNKLRISLIKNNLQWNVNLGTDGSVRDEEFVPKYETVKDLWGYNRKVINDHERKRGAEIRILAEESEVEEILYKVCKELINHNASINKTCGLHVHLDMRNRDWELAYNNLYMFQDLMFKTQPKTRHKNTYCKKLGRLLKSKDTERYYAINKQAYDKQRTLEVRLHEGSIDPKDIYMWVCFLTTVVDIKTKLIKKVNSFVGLNLPAYVERYLNERVKKYS